MRSLLFATVILLAGTAFGAAPTISTITPASGSPAGRTSVIILGSNFIPQGTTTVTFGGVPATSVSASDNSISCVTPAHAAGTVDVVVTNPDGTSVTKTGGYLYDSNAAVITGSLTVTGTLLAPLSITLTASGTAPITFTDANIPSGLSLSSTGTISGTPDVAGTFTSQVTAKNAQGSDTETLTIIISAPTFTANTTGSAKYKETLKNTEKQQVVSGSKTFVGVNSGGFALDISVDLTSVTQQLSGSTGFFLLIGTPDGGNTSVNVTLSQADKPFDGKSATFTTLDSNNKKVVVLALNFDSKKLTVKYTGKEPQSLLASNYFGSTAITDSQTITLQFGTAVAIIPLSISGTNKPVMSKHTGAVLFNVSVSGSGQSQ